MLRKMISDLKRVPALSAAGLIVLLLAVGCVARKGDSAPGEAKSGGPVATFDMKSMGGRALIDVVLNGKGPYTFFMDTGAAHSVLDAGLARELELPVTGKMQTGSPLGESNLDAELVTVSHVAVGDLQFEDEEMALIDLAAMMPGGDMPLGVLSYRIFEGYRLEFDYAGKKLHLYRGPLPEPNGTSIFGFEGEIPSIPVRIAGEEFELHLDTGSPSGITLPLAAADRLPLKSEPEVVGRGRTVDAEFEILGANLDGDAIIGGVTVAQPALRFIDAAPVGNIGSEVLGRFAVTIDPANNRLQLAESPAGRGEGGGPRRVLIGGGDEKKRYGIRFHDMDGDPISVAGVDPDSPAALAGLQAGDLIIAINGDPVESLHREARIKAMHGRSLELVVRRGDGARKMVMSLD